MVAIAIVGGIAIMTEAGIVAQGAQTGIVAAIGKTGATTTGVVAGLAAIKQEDRIAAHLPCKEALL